MESLTRQESKGSIVQIDEEQVRGHVDAVVRSSVEETLNGVLQAEPLGMRPAPRYKRTPERARARSERR